MNIAAIVDMYADPESRPESLPLRRLGGELERCSVFEAGQQLANSGEREERMAAMDILSAFCDDEPRERAANTLIRTTLGDEWDAQTLCYAIEALARFRRSGDLDLVMARAAEPSSDVRSTVAVILARYYQLGVRQDEIAECLLQLVADEDSHVREMATFVLGRQTTHTTGPIIDALLVNVGDADGAVRCEAIAALAMRGYPGIVDSLVAMLTGPIDDSYDYDALVDAAVVSRDRTCLEAAVQLGARGARVFNLNAVEDARREIDEMSRG